MSFNCLNIICYLSLILNRACICVQSTYTSTKDITKKVTNYNPKVHDTITSRLDSVLQQNNRLGPKTLELTKESALLF
jgi:hypothetical protein